MFNIVFVTLMIVMNSSLPWVCCPGCIYEWAPQLLMYNRILIQHSLEVRYDSLHNYVQLFAWLGGRWTARGWIKDDYYKVNKMRKAKQKTKTILFAIEVLASVGDWQRSKFAASVQVVTLTGTNIWPQVGRRWVRCKCSKSGDHAPTKLSQYCNVYIW